MATLSYVTFAQANSGSSMVSSETVTIPGTVQAGDSCWLLFQGYSGSSGPSTLTLTPSQSAWTQYGTTVYVAGTSSENNAALFYLDAAAADASATVVCHSSVSLFINVTLVVYRSSTGTWTIDTAPSPLSSATLVSTVPTPTGTTTSAGDWVAYFAAICNGSAGYSSCTPPSGTTMREANFGSDSGIAAVADTNAPLSASTPFGGGTFGPSTTGDYVTWSIPITPGGGSPSITTTSLPNGYIGTSYSATLQATGGTPAYTWSISSGSLPSWASLNTSTGAITGTVTGTPTTTSFTVEVTDSASLTGTANLSISTIYPQTLQSAWPGYPAPGLFVPGELIFYSTTQQYTETLAALVAASPGTPRNVRKTVGSSVTLTSVVARKILRTVIAALAIVTTVVRRMGRTLTSNVTVTVKVTNSQVRHAVLTAAMVVTVSTQKTIRRILAGQTAVTGTLPRMITCILIVPVASLGTVTRKITRTFTDTAALTVSVVRQVSRPLGALTAFTGATATARFRTAVLAVQVAMTAGVTRIIGKPLTAPVVAAGMIARRISRSVGTVIGLTTQVSRTVTRTLLTVIAVIPSVTLQRFKRITLTAVTAINVTLSRRITRPLAAVTGITDSLVKQLPKTVTSIVALSANVTRATTRTLIVSVVATGRLVNLVGKVFQAPVVNLYQFETFN